MKLNTPTISQEEITMNDMMKNTTDMTMAQNTTMVSGYANNENMELMKEIMAEDCMGLNFKMDRIKFAVAGSNIFTLPGDGEEPEITKSISCVILYNHPANAYYATEYHGGNNPPDCGSFDSVNGIGNPGGSCANCPYNQFSSGKGNAKACKNRRMLYLVREGEVFPMMLNIPTGSISEFTNYMKRLLTKGRRINQVVTKISLRKCVAKSGTEYSQAQFSVERVLNADERKVIEQMTETVKNYAKGLGMSALAVDEESPFDNVDPETGEVVQEK